MTINRHLERAGLSARVDHRSLLDRQMAAVTVGDFAKAAELDRQPEPKVGRTATAAARRGKRSPRAERVQRVRTENAQHAQAQADRFRELKAQAAADGRDLVDEQALHARALLERQQSAAQARRPLSTPRAPRHDPAPTNPSVDAPPLSLETALMLSESENPRWQPAPACAAPSTALTLGWPVADDQAPRAPALVVFCGQMHRDIETLVQRCSGFQPKA